MLNKSTSQSCPTPIRCITLSSRSLPLVGEKVSTFAPHRRHYVWNNENAQEKTRKPAKSTVLQWDTRQHRATLKRPNASIQVSVGLDIMKNISSGKNSHKWSYTGSLKVSGFASIDGKDAILVQTKYIYSSCCVPLVYSCSCVGAIGPIT